MAVKESKKMLPEDWVLASLLRTPEIIMEVNEILSPWHFLDPKKERLYKEFLQHTEEKGEPITNVSGETIGRKTVIGQTYLQTLDSNPGMAEYINWITSHKPITRDELKSVIATIIKNYQFEYTKRAYQEGVNQIVSGKPLAEVESSVMELLNVASMAGREAPIINQRQALEDFLTEFETARKAEKVKQYSSGLETLDYLLGGGFKPGDFVVIASNTGQGKSTLAGQLMLSMHNSGARVGMIGLEMDHREYVKRQVSLLSHMNGLTSLPGWILGNPTKNYNYEDFEATIRDLAEYNFYYLKPKLINVAEMKKFFKILVDKYECDVIMLDHTLLVSEKEEERIKIANVCNYMKSFAAENNIVCLAVNQMNRNSDAKNYSVDNLSGGRSVEHAATQLITIGEFDSENEWENNEFKKITLLKSRHTASGTYFKADFYGQYSRFAEILPENWDDIKEADRFGIKLEY